MPASLRRPALVAAVAAAGLFVVLLGAWALDSAVLSGQVARNVHIDGIGVGGKSETGLRASVASIGERVESRTVHLAAAHGTVDATVVDLGVTVDQDATVRAALSLGRDEPLAGRPFRWAASLLSPREAPLRFTVNTSQMASRIAALEAAEVTDPVEPSLTVRDDTVVVVPGVPGRSFDTRAMTGQLERAAAAGQGEITLEVVPLEVAPRTSDEQMQQLADEANRITARPLAVGVGERTASVPPATLRTWLVATPPSTDAGAPATPQLVLDRDRVIASVNEALGRPGEAPTELTWQVGPDDRPRFTPGKPGTTCCTAASIDTVLPALRSDAASVHLDLEAHQPARDAAWAQGLGITQRVASFTTNHPAGQARVVNIHRIADLVRGMVIAPGETWSLNGSVGKRTVEKGFVDAPVIYNGEHDSDIGGGVSQFATTTFNAAFFGGLDLVEYQSHSLYISRYPFGREATVSWEEPDLKIRNNTPYGVLLWPTYTSSSLTVTLYSTPWVTGEQTGQREQAQGRCTKVTTERTRTWAGDGHREVDTVVATYRPSEGVRC